MLFAVFFEDNPDLEVDPRARLMPAHLDFLEQNARQIEAAGPLKDDGGAPAGGLWLVEAGSAAEVQALVEDDPFWPSGLRKSVCILAWTRVFAEGRRLT
ncbi:MAG: YciI family protein [Kiloniellales bacterium]|nr:YciI family protein [Kiloniellales bacterium]